MFKVTLFLCALLFVGIPSARCATEDDADLGFLDDAEKDERTVRRSLDGEEEELVAEPLQGPVITMEKRSTSDSQADDDVSVTQPQGDFNQKLDEIIRDTIRKSKEDIEPLTLENKRYGFNRKVGIFIVTGDVRLEDMAVAGLSTLRRSGPSSLVRTAFGNIELRVQFQLGVLNLRANQHANLIGFKASSEITGRINQVTASAVVHYHPPTEEIFLKSFTLNNLDDLTVEYKTPSFKLVNRFGNLLISSTLYLVKPVLRLAVEKAAATVIRSSIKESSFLKDLMVKNAV